MKPKTYDILSDAIELGIECGYKRSFKHTEKPSKEHIIQNIHHYIMLEICEKFNFDDPGEVKPEETEENNS